jgi:HPt (histidine-containing phosphotransfer) domain-containing protein
MSLQEKMQGIRQKFCSRAGEEAQMLEQDWADETKTRAERNKLVRERAHALVGTASLLEFPELAHSSRGLEQAIDGGAEAQVVDNLVSGLAAQLKALGAAN